MEELENKLCLEQGTTVILIRPGLGRQSESMVGTLQAYTATFPIKFEVKSITLNVLFEMTDVKDVIEQREGPHFVITLKGPSDYSA